MNQGTSIRELLKALRAYEKRTCREIELILRPDGTTTLTVADEMTPPNESARPFDELESFDSFADLSKFLNSKAKA